MSFEQIKELIELAARHELSGLELERSGFRLKVEGKRPPEPVAAPSAPSPQEKAGGAAGGRAPEEGGEATAAGSGEAEAAEAPSDAHVVTSPIVGTFYRAPSPDADPFVEVGDRVKKGQVLCIVEAMKLMNEIESEVQGTVVEIFPKNAQAVEFGEPLFAIDTD